VEQEDNYRGSVERVLLIFEAKLCFGPKCLAGVETVNSSAVQGQGVLEGIIRPHEDHWLKTTSIKVVSATDDVEHVSGVP